MISTPFRAEFVLRAINRYGFGDHVTDRSALRTRICTLQRQSATWPVSILGEIAPIYAVTTYP